MPRVRSSIYSKLVPLLGERDANALMSEFPGSEGDEIVTRQFLRAELAELRSEFRTELAEIRTEVADSRTELADRLRVQTAWLVGVVMVGMGTTATVAATLG